MTTPRKIIGHKRANKALVPTAGAPLSAMLSVTPTRHPVSTLTPASAVGTALTLAKKILLNLQLNTNFEQ